MHGPMLQGSVHNSWKLKTSHQQPDQLCEGDVLHCVRQMVVTPDTDWFSDPPGPPQYSKTAQKQKCWVYNFVQCIFKCEPVDLQKANAL